MDTVETSTSGKSGDTGASFAFPLTSAQARLWFLDQLAPEQKSYLIAWAVRMRGSLNAGALRLSVNEMVRRHEVFRTRFVATEGEPVQLVMPEAQIVLPLADLTHLDLAEAEEEAHRLRRVEANTPMNLSEGPLLRGQLLRLAPENHVLLLTTHHICFDGWSRSILVRELNHFYEGFVSGQSRELPELAIQYADFAVWQREHFTEEYLDGELAYWKEQLKDLPLSVEFPTDRPRPAVQTSNGLTMPFALPQSLADRVKQISQREGVTPFMTLLAAFQVLVARYSGQEDVVVGTPTANRNRPELEGIIGLFANTLVLRTKFNGDPTFRELLLRVKETTLSAYAHEEIPFEQLVQELNPERSLSLSPLFQILFSLRNTPTGNFRLAGMELEGFGGAGESSKYDLSIFLEEQGGGYRGKIEYNTDLYDASTVERMLRHYQRVLEEAVGNPALPVSRLPLLDPDERHRILVEWNATAQEYPRNLCTHQLFEAQAERVPNKVAVRAGSDRLTFAQLNARANQVAHYLRSQGAGPGVLAGIRMTRSVNLVAALLGVFKSGAAYVPLDPNFPEDRIAFILQDANASIVITDEGWERFDNEPVVNPQIGVTADDLAYVLHTSGSTGRPKGVQITHRNLVNFLLSMEKAPGLKETDTLLAVTTISFDIAGLEIYLPLIAGATVHLASHEDATDANRLLDLFEQGITVLQATPATWRMLLDTNWSGTPELKALCGGEAVPAELVAQLLPRCAELWNMYGPTETTIWSSVCRLTETPAATASLGRPIANTTMYVLDSRLQPVPVGVAGALYIGGDGVAKGYHNRPELTAENFIANPYLASTRIYRTGDFARFDAQGQLHFLGRTDSQVKVRGFRVELGEIEAVLGSHQAVKQCVVIVREDVPGDKCLVAYLVPEMGEHPARTELRQWVKNRLPDYMVPVAWVEMERMPLSPAGKVDRRALPAPLLVRGDTSAVVAATPAEEIVAGIWAEVMRVETAGVEDNFFDLGGHSFLATRIVARVSSACGVSVPLRCLFDFPTVRGLAAEVDRLRAGGKKYDMPELVRVDRNGLLPLSFAQRRFWVMNQLRPDDTGYNIRFAIRIMGPLDTSVMHDCIAELFARNEVLRTTYSATHGVPTQTVHPARPASLEFVDVGDAGEAEAVARAVTEAEKPFDLLNGPVCRFLLYRIEAHHHVLAMVCHHICMDGASIAILFEDLATLYTQLIAGEAPQLPALRFDYADFAAWRQQWMQGEVLQEHLDFWRNDLDGIPAFLKLPVDHPDETGSMAGAIRSLTLGSEFEKAMAGFCQAQKVTQFVLMLGSLTILLHRWSTEQDFVIGTVTGNRLTAETERVCGCFLNMLPLRMRVSGMEVLRDVLLRARETVLSSFAHGQCPFETIVDTMRVTRAPGRNPIFNVGLLLQNFSEIAFRTESLEGKGIAFPRESALLDLRFVVSVRNKKVRIACEYKRELFDAETIELLLEGYSSVLQGIVHDAGVMVDAVPVPAGLLTQAEKRRELSRTKLVISATFTAELMEEPLNFWMRELEMKYEIDFAPYHQVFQQLLDPASNVRRNRDGFNALLVRFEDWRQFEDDDAAGAQIGIRRNIEELISAVKSAAPGSKASYVLCCCPASRALARDPEWAAFLQEMEERVIRELGQSGVARVITASQISELYPVQEYEDKVAEAAGHVPYTTEYFTAMATMLVRQITGLTGPQYKVVVLDCDNTLWNGVCGEDGPLGVVVNSHFSTLQKFMREQREAGMLLCLCSKNNENDVWEVFEKNPGMRLKREDISAYRVNWERKSTNLRSLAAELGLGLDSFVFLDDNPLECAEVEAECPELLTVQLPEQTDEIANFLKHVWAFDHFRSTDVDGRRGELYRDNEERERSRPGQSLEEFIESLELEIEIAALSEENVARVAQLTQRTNQFNSTTIRRQENQVRALLSPEAMQCLTVRLRDRFGDYGLIGTVIYGREKDSLMVETFLLSCRALGRRVEHAILDRLCEDACSKGLSWVDIRFSPTPKNQPVHDFLDGIEKAVKVLHSDGVTYRVGVERITKGLAGALEAAV